MAEYRRYLDPFGGIGRSNPDRACFIWDFSKEKEIISCLKTKGERQNEKNRKKTV